MEPRGVRNILAEPEPSRGYTLIRWLWLLPYEIYNLGILKKGTQFLKV
jgi:hypothetical protein